jgi:hypothetical protein
LAGSWSTPKKFVKQLLSDADASVRASAKRMLVGSNYTPFAKDISASVGLTAVPIAGLDGVNPTLSGIAKPAEEEQDPLGSVREDIQLIEDKLYERGFLVSATGSQQAEVSISFGEWGEGDDRGLYWIIAITSDISKQVDDEKFEEISDYVSGKISDFSDEWPESVNNFIEDSFGQVVLLNGKLVY